MVIMKQKTTEQIREDIIDILIKSNTTGARATLITGYIESLLYNSSMENNVDEKQQVVNELVDLGFDVVDCGSHIQFKFKGSLIKYFPNSKWASGKTIDDCRGFDNLVKQLK